MTLNAQALLAELDTTLSEVSQDWRTAVLRQIADMFFNGAELYSKDQVALFDAVMSLPFAARALKAQSVLFTQPDQALILAPARATCAPTGCIRSMSAVWIGKGERDKRSGQARGWAFRCRGAW